MSESGFDWVWTVIPQISTYQTLVALATGWNAFTAGFTAPYPVFAQDTPPFTLNQSSTLNQTDGKPAECNSDSDPYQAVFESDVFESTFVTEFYLICNRAHLNSYAIQVSFIGIFIGAFVGGWTADKFGRKKTMVLSMLATSISLLLQGILPTYALFLICRCLVMAFQHMAFIAYCCFVCEIVGPKGRKVMGMMPHILYALGYMFLSLVSFVFRDWRQFTIALAILQGKESTSVQYFQLYFYCYCYPRHKAPYIFTAWIYDESPRWLYTRGRIDQAEAGIKKLLRKTKTRLVDVTEEEFLLQLRNKIEKEEVHDDPTTSAASLNVQPKANVSIATLFTISREITYMNCCICLIFIILTMGYYGLSFSAGSFPGNIFVNHTLNGVVELIAYVASSILLDKLGRRTIMGGPLLLASSALIGGMALSEFVGGATAIQVSRWLMFVGKLGVSAAFAVVWIWVAEMYPTDVRTIALGMGSMSGRLGGIISPLILRLYDIIPWAPPLIFGVACFIGSILVLTLPETTGQPMLTTTAEAREHYQKRK